MRRNVDAANRGGTRKTRISEKNSNNGKRDKRDGEQDGMGAKRQQGILWGRVAKLLDATASYAVASCEIALLSFSELLCSVPLT